jgi:hypothetical protein
MTMMDGCGGANAGVVGDGGRRRRRTTTTTLRFDNWTMYFRGIRKIVEDSQFSQKMKLKTRKEISSPLEENSVCHVASSSPHPMPNTKLYYYQHDPTKYGEEEWHRRRIDCTRRPRRDILAST